jgi:hypothetical protein
MIRCGCLHDHHQSKYGLLFATYAHQQTFLLGVMNSCLLISVSYKHKGDLILYKPRYLLRDEQDLSLGELMSPIYVMFFLYILCLQGGLCGILPRSHTSFVDDPSGYVFWSNIHFMEKSPKYGSGITY